MSGRIAVAEKAARTLDGITFASAAEMRRYAELRMLERAGRISDLECQPAFVLQPAFRHKTFGAQRAITYRADFRYLDRTTNRIIVEDLKGHRTELYTLKKKLLLARYPDINFVEVKA